MLTRAVWNRLTGATASTAEAEADPDFNTVVTDTIPPETMTDAERVRYLNYHTGNQHGR